MNETLADAQAAYTKLETMITAVSDALVVMVQTTSKILTAAQPAGQQLARAAAAEQRVTAAEQRLAKLRQMFLDASGAVASKQ